MNGTIGFNPVYQYIHWDFRDDAELLAQWGVIYRRSFKFQKGWGDWCEAVTAKHPTAEDADAQAREMVLSMGYSPPKWYEFWRIGELPLPKPLINKDE